LKITETSFGVYNTESIAEYTLSNENNLSLKILTLGGIIREVNFCGNNRVLGFNKLEDYVSSRFYFGALVGRVSGRISNGKIVINRKYYKLDQNEGTTCLHGGRSGFTFRVWKLESRNISNESASITLKYTSPDLECGFPGELTVLTKYTIYKDDSFTIEYLGDTTKSTTVTLTNHSYFNLNNNLGIDVLNHYLRIDSDNYIKLDKNNIPTKICGVEGTPFDFRRGKTIELDMDLTNDDLKYTKGYDHPLILNKCSTNQIELYCKNSGVKLNISTTEPVVILYCSNNLSEGYYISEGKRTFRYQGVCLETQWYPDALNQNFLPDNIFKPSDKYYSKTRYAFNLSDYK